MTLTPEEIVAYAKTFSYPMTVISIDGLLTAYLRLVYDRPSLDLDDARAIVMERIKLNPPHDEPTLADLDRSDNAFWRSNV